MIEIFLKLEGFQQINFNDFESIEKLFVYLNKKNENSREIQSLQISLTCLLALIPKINPNLLIGNWRPIIYSLDNEMNAKLSTFSKGVENLKFLVCQGFKNIKKIHQELRESLENKKKMIRQRILYQEFINKIEVKVCVTNLVGRKGYLTTSMNKLQK